MMILEESIDRCGRRYWDRTTESIGSILESGRVLENLRSLGKRILKCVFILCMIVFQFGDELQGRRGFGDIG